MTRLDESVLTLAQLAQRWGVSEDAIATYIANRQLNALAIVTVVYPDAGRRTELRPLGPLPDSSNDLWHYLIEREPFAVRTRPPWIEKSPVVRYSGRLEDVRVPIDEAARFEQKVGLRTGEGPLIGQPTGAKRSDESAPGRDNDHSADPAGHALLEQRLAIFEDVLTDLLAAEPKLDAFRLPRDSKRRLFDRCQQRDPVLFGSFTTFGREFWRTALRQRFCRVEASQDAATRWLRQMSPRCVPEEITRK